MNVRFAGIILAGGKSSRFAGGAKETALLDGRALLDHVIARAAPQVSVLAVSRVSAGGDDRGLPVVIDSLDGGPLAGLHAGLVWAAALRPQVTHLATFPCDSPLFPDDLVARLGAAAVESGAPAIPVCGETIHPAFGVWPAGLQAAAAKRLASEDRSLRGFATMSGAILVEFADADAFLNVNTTEDMTRAEALLAKLEPHR